MLEFFRTETSLTLQKINEIEAFIGLIFPKNYKEHLLLNNGGQCKPNIFSFNEMGTLSNSSIDWFLAIYDGKHDNLMNYLKIYKVNEKRLPSHILPIAHDPGGNLICISCDTADVGSIFFWDHEKEIDYRFSDDTDYSNLYFITNDFDEFLNSLKESI